MNNQVPGQFMNQQQTEVFLLTRGGNRGKTFDAWEGFGENENDNDNTNNTTMYNMSFNNQKNNTPVPYADQYKNFYKGDKILNGDYFKGWNDTYFFQSSVFRQNMEFWINPFKPTVSK